MDISKKKWRALYGADRFAGRQNPDHSLLECLADTPFEKITVEQLCRGALINRSTFYKYYTSKYDLMERYLNRALDGFRRQVDVAFVNASPRTIQKLVYQKNFENVLENISTSTSRNTP